MARTFRSCVLIFSTHRAILVDLIQNIANNSEIGAALIRFRSTVSGVRKTVDLNVQGGVTVRIVLSVEHVGDVFLWKEGSAFALHEEWEL